MSQQVDELRKRFLEDLLSKPLDSVSSLWILEKFPYIFKGDAHSLIAWKHTLSNQIEVDPSCITIIGSAAAGFSLNPNKNLREFDSPLKSDIDVAIVSDYHFSVSWRYLRGASVKKHVMPPAAKAALNDHVRRLIYWGTIATDKILTYLPYGRDWSGAMEQMAQLDPTSGRIIKFRVYRDHESLRAYHINNLSELRNSQLERESMDV